LLLGHAVNRTEPQDEIAAGYAHDFAVREKACEYVQGGAIIGIVERGHKHDLVRDIEIGVARGQPCPWK